MLPVFRSFQIKYSLILLSVTACFNVSVNAQNQIDAEYINLVKLVIKEKHKDYQYLDATFNQMQNDTLKMDYLYKASKKVNYYEGESYALNKLGIVYRNNSFYNRAIQKHIEAESLATKANNTELKVLSLNMLGVVYRRLDLIRAALDYHKQALDLAEASNNTSETMQRSIAVSLNSMGNIYLALEQYELALSQFSKSLKIEKRVDNKLGLAINYHNIGYAKEQGGFLEEALGNYKISLKYNNKINSEVGRAICYNSIGKIYIKQGNYKEALPIINLALEKSNAIKDQYYISTSYLNLGWLQLKLDELTNAETNLEKALKIADEYNLKSAKIEAYEHFSELNEKRGDFKSAMNYYKKAIALNKTITNQRNLQYVNDLIIKYDAEKKNSEINALASENEIVKLKLEQNKKTLMLSVFGLLLLGIILFVLNRQRQLKDEKRYVMLEQDMLRNQMNPHFIFNSLNSIKLYIINNEKENAVYYLNKFSKLIRKILVASNEKEITLKDELDTLATYMNIENIRFSNEILYKVHIDDDVDPTSIKVPSLIFQPFLENALWHGLSLKEKDKRVILTIKKTSDNFATITIEDNGVGRVASQKIKRQKTLNRKSLGISLTKERLANFSKGYNSMYSINIEDLYDHDNNAAGTKVVINIPLKKIELKTA